MQDEKKPIASKRSRHNLNERNGQLPTTATQFPPQRITMNNLRDLTRLLGVSSNTLASVFGTRQAFVTVDPSQTLANRALEMHVRLIARNPQWMRLPQQGVLELIGEIAAVVAGHEWVAVLRTANGKLLIDQPLALERLVTLMLGRHSTSSARMRSWRSTQNVDSLAWGLIWAFARCSVAERPLFVSDWIEAFRDQIVAECLDLDLLLRGKKTGDHAPTVAPKKSSND